MWKRIAVLTALMGAVVSGAAGAENIVLVSLDDVGVDKLAIYGFPAPAPTPNIDELAEMGVTFERAWAYPLCSPSRAAMLTGLTPSRNGVGTNVRFDGSIPDGAVGLDPAMPNLANVLRTNGYRTAAVGKWHLSGADTAQNVVDHPNDAGFDDYAGNPVNPGASVTGLAVDGYFEWERCENGACALSSSYLTTGTTDDAIAQLSGAEPFFLYVAYSAAHRPNHDPPAELHSFDGQCQPSPAAFTPVCHKAMIEAADTELGRLLDAIDWTDTTLILLGDNGSPAATVEAPLATDHSKGSLYQGGIHIPLLVVGEAVAEEAMGESSDALVGVTDIFATVMEIAGASATTVSSVSFAPMLLDPAAPSTRQTLYSESFAPNGLPPSPERHRRAVRDAKYKVIRLGNQQVEFYDLAADPYERTPIDPFALPSERRRAFATLASLVGVTTVPEPARALLQIAAVLTVLLTKRSARRGATDPK